MNLLFLTITSILILVSYKATYWCLKLSLWTTAMYPITALCNYNAIPTSYAVWLPLELIFMIIWLILLLWSTIEVYRDSIQTIRKSTPEKSAISLILAFCLSVGNLLMLVCIFA